MTFITDGDAHEDVSAEDLAGVVGGQAKSSVPVNRAHEHADQVYAEGKQNSEGGKRIIDQAVRNFGYKVPQQYRGSSGN